MCFEESKFPAQKEVNKMSKIKQSKQAFPPEVKNSYVLASKIHDQVDCNRATVVGRS